MYEITAKKSHLPCAKKPSWQLLPKEWKIKRDFALFIYMEGNFFQKPLEKSRSLCYNVAYKREKYTCLSKIK